jgi:hypothetical protein
VKHMPTVVSAHGLASWNPRCIAVLHNCPKIRYVLLHEACHIIAYATDVEARWTAAIRKDGRLRVSIYGSTNHSEDAAEFGVLYCFCQKEEGRMAILKKLMPNRTALWADVCESFDGL